MENKIPQKSELIRLDLIRIDKNTKKDCTCQQPNYDLDADNRRATCVACGAIVDHFDALLKIARRHEDYNYLMQQRRDQAIYLDQQIAEKQQILKDLNKRINQ